MPSTDSVWTYPRKADLHRWRETFAEKLREYAIDAEATRQATRGVSRNHDPIWRQKACQEGRLRSSPPSAKSGPTPRASRADATDAWRGIAGALASASRALA